MGVIKNTMMSFSYATMMSWEMCKKQLLLLGSMKLLSALLPVTLIWCTEKLINSVNQFINDGVGLNNMIFFFILEVSIILSTFIMQKLVLIVDQRMANIFKLKFKNIMFDKQKLLPFELFEKHHFQDKLNRLNTNDTKIIMAANNGLDCISNIISLLGVILYLFNISWLFAPLLLIGVIPLIVVQFKLGKKRYELFKFLIPFGRKEYYINQLLNTPHSLQEIRLYSTENYFIDKWSESFELTSSKNLDITIKQSKWLIITQLVQMVFYLISGFLAILLIIRGAIVVGSFVAILQSIQRLQGMIINITSSLSEIYEASFFISDYKEFLNLIEDNTLNNEPIKKIYSLKVSNLSYQYPNSNKFALKDINLDIPIGKNIAIVGVNGSGKTTLLKCLTGLYKTNLSLFINEKPIEKIELKSYRERIAVLFQEYNRYELTAKENIGFGRIKYLNSLEDIQKPAKLTNIHSYIDGLPDKYDSTLGRLYSQGHELSGGQWQRIALARTLFRNGDIMFLDEPTSALDPKSELDLIESMFNQVSNSHSIVYITHRLAATKFADEIIVLKEGSIVEKGTHSELINQRGEYYRLYEIQKKWYSNSEKIKEVVL